MLVCNSLNPDWLAQKVDEDWKHTKKRWKFTPELVGTTLTNYLALPGAPKPVVKKAFWGNKTPYGDRNSSSSGIIAMAIATSPVKLATSPSPTMPT